MRIIAAFIILMVCGLSAAGQRDSVIVNDGWRKDTIRVKGQVIDTLGKETEMIIWVQHGAGKRRRKEKQRGQTSLRF